MKATFNLKASGEVFQVKRMFLRLFGLSQESLAAGEYEVRAQVPVSAVETFVKIVHGEEIEISEENCEPLRLLAEELQFEELRGDCAAFEALHPPPCEATPEAVTAALAKRVSHLEEQTVLLERRSAMVGRTVRSLCDQLAFLESEVRRLSEGCDGLGNQQKLDTVDNLTSAAGNRPLSANQGRILN
jgi:hypothetical protein